MHKRNGHENISFPEFIFTSELKETSTSKPEKFIKNLSNLKLSCLQQFICQQNRLKETCLTKVFQKMVNLILFLILVYKFETIIQSPCWKEFNNIKLWLFIIIYYSLYITENYIILYYIRIILLYIILL